jgi:adenine-specific DNA-methyltransferase
MWFHKDCGHNQEATQEVKALFADIGVPFSNPKPTRLLRQIMRIGTSANANDIVLDFFAGSGTTGHAAFVQNVSDSGNRKYILVQLPEPLDPGVKEQKFAAECCDKLRKPRTIAELTKERLRRAAKKIKEENPMFAGDLGFRVFKLDSTNIREWDPNRDNLAVSLEASVDHLKTDRTEQDILFELLLKLGLDLCVPIETKKIGEHDVHNIGAGTLLVCLSRSIPSSDVEPLALGLVAWHKELKPAGETTVVFRDSAFADDVAKTNLTAILEQNGITNVRSL